MSEKTVKKWLTTKLRIDEQTVELLFTAPQQLRADSCSARYRVTLAQLIKLQFPNGMRKDYVCRALDLLGYKLAEYGEIQKVVSREGSTTKDAMQWVHKSVASVPWTWLHEYSQIANWTPGMVHLFFTRYVKRGESAVQNALSSAAAHRTSCKSLQQSYDNTKSKREAKVRQQEMYTGEEIVNGVLPRANIVLRTRTEGGEYVPIDGKDIKRGQVVYRPYRSSKREPSPVTLPFGADDIFTLKQLRRWMSKVLKMSGSTMNRALNG